ncbi:Disease resistance protein RPS2 [Senna tora]|uniref:Disease resistance protein RPS2 n=1 Tax=Senna tora TaxID=362788 RepID=A0A834SMX1_9FABA|nr:Disease resistance protein RPS2 [Senna tora]
MEASSHSSLSHHSLVPCIIGNVDPPCTLLSGSLFNFGQSITAILSNNGKTNADEHILLSSGRSLIDMVLRLGNALDPSTLSFPLTNSSISLQ